MNPSQCLQQRLLSAGLLTSLLAVLKRLAPPATSSHARILSGSKGASQSLHRNHSSDERLLQPCIGRQEQGLQGQREEQEQQGQQEQQEQQGQQEERELTGQAGASASVASQICLAAVETLSLLLAGNRGAQVGKAALGCRVERWRGRQGGREGGREAREGQPRRQQ